MFPTTTPNTVSSTKDNANLNHSSEEQSLGWIKGVGLEWSKITWPTRMQLVKNVTVVLIMTGMMTLFVW